MGVSTLGAYLCTHLQAQTNSMCASSAAAMPRALGNLNRMLLLPVVPAGIICGAAQTALHILAQLHIFQLHLRTRMTATDCQNHQDRHGDCTEPPVHQQGMQVTPQDDRRSSSPDGWRPGCP